MASSPWNSQIETLGRVWLKLDLGKASPTKNNCSVGLFESYTTHAQVKQVVLLRYKPCLRCIKGMLLVVKQLVLLLKISSLLGESVSWQWYEGCA